MRLSTPCIASFVPFPLLLIAAILLFPVLLLAAPYLASAAVDLRAAADRAQEAP